MTRKIAAVFASVLILAGCKGEAPSQDVSPSNNNDPGIGFTYNGKPGISFGEEIPLVIPFDGSSPGMGWSP